MPIFVDPTETRPGSRLYQAVRDIAVELPGLERRTGADILVSLKDGPHKKDKALRRLIRAGLLIQRKSGGDLASSITDGRLYRSLGKMLKWSDRPWLLYCGTMAYSQFSGQAIVDGRNSMPYMSIAGALTWWQLRGGYYSQLESDELQLKWLSKWLDTLQTLQDVPEKHIGREAAQLLVGAAPQRETLMTLPGIGQQKAELVLAQYGGIASALVGLTADEIEVALAGIGPKTRAHIRAWLGMSDGERLLITHTKRVEELIRQAFKARDFMPEDKWPGLYAAAMQAVRVDATGTGVWDKWVREEIAEYERSNDEQGAER